MSDTEHSHGLFDDPCSCGFDPEHLLDAARPLLAAGWALVKVDHIDLQPAFYEADASADGYYLNRIGTERPRIIAMAVSEDTSPPASDGTIRHRRTGELDTTVSRLRAAISQAIEDLDAEHQQDKYAMVGDPLGCVICWPHDGGWPCYARMVADDLRQALGDEE